MYTIRRNVLNMPLSMWQKLPAGEVIETTVESFLAEIGLPGGVTAKFNEQEKAFFKDIYALNKVKKYDKNGQANNSRRH